MYVYVSEFCSEKYLHMYIYFRYIRINIFNVDSNKIVVHHF